MIIIFPITELRTFQSVARQLFWHSNNLSIIGFLFFLSFFIFFRLCHDEHCRQQPQRFFVVLFDTPVFDAWFNSIELPVTIFLEWVPTAVFPAEKEITERTEVMALRRESAMTILQFRKNEYLALCGSGIERPFLLLRASLAVHRYSPKDGQIQKLFSYLIRERSLSFTSSASGAFLSLWSRMNGSCK